MNGILIIDKESDWTSNDVVIKLKGILHERRVGHSGTLDPLATGVLAVFVGRATRAVEFAESDTKRYIAGFRPGITTDTQDVTGNILRQVETDISEDDIRKVIPKFTGEIDQIPPMYSAIKVKGQRLYDIARKGGEVERKARRITVSAIDVVGREGGDFVLDISCSKGTYIRTLCNDIGEALGCGGCMSSLRRVRAGVFGLEDAVKISDVQIAKDEGRLEEMLIPVDRLFSDRPRATADKQQEKKLRCGNEVRTALQDGEYRVYSDSGEFLLLGKAYNGILTTVKSFFEV